MAMGDRRPGEPEREPARVPGRGERAELVRAGFASLDEAAAHLDELAEASGVTAQELRASIGPAVADPDLALATASRLARRHPDHARRMLRDEGLRETLLIVAGGSMGLGELALRDPESIDAAHEGRDRLDDPEAMSGRIVDAVGLRDGSDPGAPTAALEGEAGRTALRRAYRRELARIARFDLAHDDPASIVPEVSRACTAIAEGALEASLRVARADLSAPPAGFGRFPAEQIAAVRLGVLAMGKCGARELNIISDVDVVFVVEPAEGSELPAQRAIEIGTRLASKLMQGIAEAGHEPPLWEVDANLRPEGKDGALVRSLDSYAKYYERWAKNWEFQALLKMRPAAGDLELGQDLVDRLSPLVWASAARADFVEQARAMRERVTDHIPDDELDIQLKLGPGGLRDIEFTVQLLQLVHGQVDETLRVRRTFDAIAALSEGGYIGRDDAARFDEDYRALRLMEHRLQLRRLKRTHLMPRDPDELRILARACRAENADALVASWQRTKIEVRGLHEKVFYRPLLSAVAALPSDSFHLTSEQAEARLRAIGFRDTKGALGHLSALVGGVSRRAQIQRTLLPVMLDWFAERANPDQGLLAFRKLSEQLGDTSWYLRTLRDSSAAAKRLARLLGDSRFVAMFLELHPDAVRWLDDDRQLEPRPLEALVEELRRTVRRHDDEESIRRAIRTFRRREVLRLAIGGMLEVATIEQTGQGLSDVGTAVLRAALATAERLDAAEYPPFAIIGMGRYGGAELGFGSDLDVLYVTDVAGADDPDAAMRRATQLVSRMGAILQDPRLPLELDADLRPEGRKGPLVRSLEAYRAYYEKWSLGWEAQALLRARPVAGDEELAGRFMELADVIRYPAALAPAELVEIRRIKARVESERLPQGADPARHLKLGRGSLSDVEWLVQALQLQHAARIPELRTTSTLGALQAAVDAELLATGDAATLREAWTLASRLRSDVFLQTNKATDVLPRDLGQLSSIGRLIGMPPGSGAKLDDEYLGVTRRARRVFERVFYGQ